MAHPVKSLWEMGEVEVLIISGSVEQSFLSGRTNP